MMHRLLKFRHVPPLLLATCLAADVAARAPLRGPLRIATWNLEWLVDAETARAARVDCRAARPTALPCDVALGLARDSADLARLGAYARQLDADVIAFQEVQNEKIAERVFSGYRVCIVAGPGLQQVGFALRPGLARDCGRPLSTLAEGARLAGLALTITAPHLGPLELLVVHLKSGCAHDPLSTPRDACQLLSRQAVAVGHWIARHTAQEARFIVLGDFNRGGFPRAADPFWSLLQVDAMVVSSSTLPFANCVWGAPYRDFIDHILVSRNLAPLLEKTAFTQLRFRPADTVHYLLSDHCPVRVSLNVASDL
jgi:endonuclease/exonuclease/phosphatase family metal-dependent hydrolase